MQVRATQEDRYDEVLTDGAMALVGRLHEELDARRRELLEERLDVQSRLDAGESLDFTAAPEDFTVAPVPDALQDRRVEITGPTSRKMVINALNSGARGFMADFEDSNSPYWSNMIERPGQPRRRDPRLDRARREGQALRARGRPGRAARAPARAAPARAPPPARTASQVAGAFVDFGLYVHRNAEALLERGCGAVLLHPEARVAAGGGAVARRVRDRRGGARPRPRHDQGDRPDRDDPGRVLHGRDPVRAARPRRRPERRPLGLHLLGDQALPLAARVRDCRTART